LPLRRWLVLALLASFLIPFLVTGFLVFHLAGVADEFDDTDTAAALGLLREEQASWDDPAWQAATRARLADMDVDFVLMEGGNELYRSSADPFLDADGDARSRRVEQLTIPGVEPTRSALVYGEIDTGPPDDIWMAPVVALTTLLVMLSAIGWYLGRTVVRPLAATSDAAHQIATGDLNVSLPASRVREVYEVSSALDLMSRELRASIEQQAELEQERRMFVGAVAHDLRTPLFSLRGALEGIESGLANTPEKRAHYISVARQKADALERLISDLFDYTRLEYLDQTPKREPLDLTALMLRLVDGSLPQAEAKGIELVLAAPDGPCTVQGDEHMLTRAIENLLDNALRFTPPGGTVRIECGPAAGGLSFSILDSGPGIPTQDLPHLFAPLYRGETSRNRSTGGAGLGLAIARRILRAHGGDLTAGNHADGAVFTASLPVPAANA
jgi:signal transduction histidine kinase